MNKKIKPITVKLHRYYYYGDQLTIREASIYDYNVIKNSDIKNEYTPTTVNKKEKSYFDNGCDCDEYCFICENRNSFIKALQFIVEQIEKEGFDCEIKNRHIYDLKKLIEDKLLGDELYQNFVENILFISDYKNDLYRFVCHHNPRYSCGNNLQVFGKDDVVILTRKPEEFKKECLNYIYSTYDSRKKPQYDKIIELLNGSNETMLEVQKQNKIIDIKRKIENHKNNIASLEKQLEELLK